MSGKTALHITTILVLGCVVVLSILKRYRGANAAESQGEYYAHVIPGGRAAYNFELTDQNGKTLRLDEMRGNLVLLTFGFTHCPNICPTTMAHLNAIYSEEPMKVQRRTKVVFVTIDPERDSPRVMKDYVSFFNASFIGLTGGKKQIENAETGYAVVHLKQASANASGNYNIDHSTYVYVISQEGRWTAIYDNDQLSDAKSIVHDLERFLNQSPK